MAEQDDNGRVAAMDFYRLHANDYAEATRDVDMRPFYAHFLGHVPEGGHVLDAGCGSGRDALAFSRMGLKVAAFDASPDMAALASQHAGIEVEVLSFSESVDAVKKLHGPFDGIWACASLLHVPEAEQRLAWAWLWSLLKTGGVIYASYKLGTGERTDALGRTFTDGDEERVQTWSGGLPGIKVLETWLSQDQRNDSRETWFNVLVRQQHN